MKSRTMMSTSRVMRRVEVVPGVVVDVAERTPMAVVDDADAEWMMMRAGACRRTIKMAPLQGTCV